MQHTTSEVDVLFISGELLPERAEQLRNEGWAVTDVKPEDEKAIDGAVDVLSSRTARTWEVMDYNSPTVDPGSAERAIKAYHRNELLGRIARGDGVLVVKREAVTQNS